jgi:hypothetical protein
MIEVPSIEIYNRLIANGVTRYSRDEVLATIAESEQVAQQYTEVINQVSEAVAEQSREVQLWLEAGSTSRCGSSELYPVKKWQKQIANTRKAIAELT